MCLIQVNFYEFRRVPFDGRRLGARTNIRSKSNRSEPSPYLNRRNQVERFFNRIMQCHRGQRATTNLRPTT